MKFRASSETSSSVHPKPRPESSRADTRARLDESCTWTGRPQYVDITLFEIMSCREPLRLCDVVLPSEFPTVLACPRGPTEIQLTAVACAAFCHNCQTHSECRDEISQLVFQCSKTLHVDWKHGLPSQNRSWLALPP